MRSFNEVIQVEILTKSKLADGTPTETWEFLAEVRADVVLSEGGTLDYDSDTQNISNDYTIKFFTRYFEDFGYDCRIKYDSEVYKIVYIKKTLRNRGFEVHTERSEGWQ